MDLNTVWFILIAVLFIGYFFLEGFDYGVGILLPFLAKDDRDRRVIINTIGPHWDGNEVWLITAGGVTFAAFPKTYAVMFSGLYTPLMLLLFALILRGVSFEFRSKEPGRAWRSTWDACLVIGSFVPALLLGVAFANIFRGIPIDAEGINHGTLLTLLNPYGLLGGVLFVLLFSVHGALWLAIKSEGALQKRAASTARMLWPILLVAAAGFLVASWFATNLYNNLLAHPVLFILPALAVAGLVLTRVYVAGARWWSAWFASFATILGATMYGVAGLFPNLLPSSLDPAFSMTAFNTSSSPLTLKIMLGVALAFLPVVIAYQVWAYAKFRDKVTAATIAGENAY